MGTYYKVLANIYINHEYFAGGQYPSAVLMPLPQTQLFLKNHRIILKQKKEGFAVLQEASDETNDVTISFDEVVLFFGIKLNDPNFQVRSGLKYDLRKEKLVVKAASEDVLNVNQKNIMTIIYSSSEVDFSSPVLVTDEHKNIVFDSQTDSQIQFNALDNGIYELNGKRFFKYNSDLNYDIVLMLPLNAGDENKECKMMISAGSYKWRYQVLKKYHPAKSLRLLDENEVVLFEEVASAEADKYVFVSTLPVKLSQTVSSIISVYENDTIVKKYLPLPEISNARFFDANDKSLVLEAYVTV